MILSSCSHPPVTPGHLEPNNSAARLVSWFHRFRLSFCEIRAKQAYWISKLIAVFVISKAADGPKEQSLFLELHKMIINILYWFSHYGIFSHSRKSWTIEVWVWGKPAIIKSHFISWLWNYMMFSIRDWFFLTNIETQNNHAMFKLVNISWHRKLNDQSVHIDEISKGYHCMILY